MGTAVAVAVLAADAAVASDSGVELAQLGLCWNIEPGGGACTPQQKLENWE